MRLKPGNEVTLFDGQGRSFRACLDSVQGKCLVAAIIRAEDPDDSPAICVHLVQGLPKGDKMDLIVQKAVEIGVDSICPLQCRRSISRLKGDTMSKKLQRWQSVAKEACKQSGRNRLLKIRPFLHLSPLLDEIKGHFGVVLYERERKTGYRQILQKLTPACREKDLYLLVGPEGGWDDSEIEEMVGKGIYTASLGPKMLRTETAGLIAAALALYEAGELGKA